MQNPEKQGVNPADSLIMDDDENKFDANVGTASVNGHSQANMRLGAEAVADFQALHGYWKRIIVKDMSGDLQHELPRVSIA